MNTRCKAPPTPEMAAQEKIEMYKRVQGTKFHVNPLSFYDEHKSKFPWILALSLKYVCVPANSVPFKRACPSNREFVTCELVINFVSSQIGLRNKLLLLLLMFY